MTYIKYVISKTDLKKKYRNLAMTFHPDKGGNGDVMKQINEEYKIWQQGFSSRPRDLRDIQVGNTVYVNSTQAIVIEVQDKLFKAKSLKTARELYFDKETGYAQFNLKFRAYINYEVN